MSRAFLLAAAAALAVPGSAAADDLRDTVAADLPSFPATYRNLPASRAVVPRGTLGEDHGRRRAQGGSRSHRKGRQDRARRRPQERPGPTALLRADMDALPVEEQTGCPTPRRRAPPSRPRASTAGVMHACGHDTHMAAWIGAARALTKQREKWSGTLVMIGQPAEEIVAGAEAMLAEGLFTPFPKPDFALAMHDTADLGSGVIGLTPGFALANVNSVDITVKGLGGHGAYPQTTKDPIVLASAIVTRLQTLVSREASAFDPAVVTVGSIHGGAKHNIIPDEVKLQLTVRSYSAESRKRL